jgi:hypothetical protein
VIWGVKKPVNSILQWNCKPKGHSLIPKIMKGMGLKQAQKCEFKIKSIYTNKKKVVNASSSQNGAWINHGQQTFTRFTTT